MMASSKERAARSRSIFIEYFVERVIRANSQWSSGKTEMAKKRDHTGRGFTRSQQLGALLIVFLLIGLLIYRVMS
jgi:hypothetical protein